MVNARTSKIQPTVFRRLLMRGIVAQFNSVGQATVLSIWMAEGTGAIIHCWERGGCPSAGYLPTG